MPLCSIIVPVHNWASVTRQCLDSVLASPLGVDAEVIVVDDASRDLTPRVLEEYGDRIRVVTHGMNTGFATACNDGAAVAQGEFLVFLNNDTLPQDGWLRALADYATAHPQASVVGAKLLNADGTVQHAGVVVCQDRITRAIYAGFPADHHAVNRSRRFRAVTGACMLVRRAAFEQVGGFDTDFFNAYEDHDLCLRLGELGYETHYCHESVVYHLESITRSRVSEDHARSTMRYRARWSHRLEPDDLRFYIRDGLIRLTYGTDVPLTMAISPQLAVLDGDLRDAQVDRLLGARARQVFDLQQENARLAAQLLEARAAAVTPAPGAPSDADAGTTAPDEPEFSPPPEMVYRIGGDFEAGGLEYMEYFTAIGRLTPDESVLDVGSGIGRMAAVLTKYLSSTGQYRGFDVTEDAVRWCREHITARYPNFQFHYAPIHNRFYNAASSEQAAAFRFPYDDASFDFVFLTSVFTHMLPPEVERYAAEIVRVLKPGGRCLITYFLLNEESVGLTRAGFGGPFVFRPVTSTYSAIYPDFPERAVAYSERYVRDLYRNVGLTLEEPIRYGRWCGRLDGLSLQDMVLGVKPAE